MDWKNILRSHIERKVNLADEQFEYIASFFKPMSFKKKDKLIRPGETVHFEYFVLSGCLATYVVNDEQKMHILQFAMSTWWASDYNALYNNVEASLHVDCVSDAEVLCLSNEDHENMCRQLHSMESFFRWRSNGGYVSLQRRILSLLNNDAQSRYEELMQQYPALYNLVPKHLIAAYLGVSRETLSRFQSH